MGRRMAVTSSDEVGTVVRMMAVLNFEEMGMIGMKRTKSPSRSREKRWTGATKWREWLS